MKMLIPSETYTVTELELRLQYHSTIRLTGVKHLRVRGLKAVSFAATLKALGLNILRSTRFKFDQKVAFAT